MNFQNETNISYHTTEGKCLGIHFGNSSENAVNICTFYYIES